MLTILVKATQHFCIKRRFNAARYLTSVLNQAALNLYFQSSRNHRHSISFSLPSPLKNQSTFPHHPLPPSPTLPLQERERRRHHMLLVKALDARRRQEERDRRREDMKVERAALKERRREKRLQDAEVIRQLKKPREDMALTGEERKNRDVVSGTGGGLLWSVERLRENA